jgi:hypothetical protein
MACPFVFHGFLKKLMDKNFVQFQGVDNEIFIVSPEIDAAHRNAEFMPLGLARLHL